MSERRFGRILSTLAHRQTNLTVVMENVHKTRNFAALSRTCDAVGVGEIHAIAPAETSVRVGHKTAGGTKRWVRVRRHTNVSSAYQTLRDAGFAILVADVAQGATDFRAIDYTQATAIVFGSELDGLSHAAVSTADERVGIPMFGMVESLNVSVAAGIILYEAARQREAAGLYDVRQLDDDEYYSTAFEWLHPQVARYCQRHSKSYPKIDASGSIVEAVTENN